MNSKPKVVLCTPVMEQVSSRFYIDAQRLVMRMTNLATKGVLGFSVLTRQNSILSDKRHFMAQRVLDDGWATHILWIDSDMGFEADIGLKLLAHDKPIVACACPIKDIPSHSTAVKQKGPNEFEPIDPFSVTGLVPVDFVGMGVMLTSMEVFKTIPSPWFETIWRAERGCYEGEDWYFIRKAREHGFQAYIDAEASQGIEHIGAFAFNHALAYAEGDSSERVDPEHGLPDGRVLPVATEPAIPHDANESKGSGD